jgi:hypothetical protein
VSSGRVYISRDVVFDEAVFPFKSLHPNAGALLHQEILLLPSTLHNPEHGDEFVDDINMTNVPINSASSPICVDPQVTGIRTMQAGENSAQSGAQNSGNNTPSQNLEEDRDSGHEVDFLPESSSDQHMDHRIARLLHQTQTRPPVVRSCGGPHHAYRLHRAECAHAKQQRDNGRASGWIFFDASLAHANVLHADGHTTRYTIGCGRLICGCAQLRC